MDYLDFFHELLLEHNKEVLPYIFSTLENENDPMTGVHFSRGIYNKDPIGRVRSIDPHLSTNPKPSHYDPLGIYVFPKEYVLSGGLKNNTGFYNSKFWYIIRPIRSKCKILNLSKITDNELKSILGKMGIPEEYFSDTGVYHKSSGEQPGHKLWGIMEKYMHDVNTPPESKTTSGLIEGYGKNIGWNVLFKKAGINTLIDDGDKIIHSNEPQQVVYMEPGTYEVVSNGQQKIGSSIMRDVIKEFPNYRVKSDGRFRQGTYKISLFDDARPRFQITLTYYSDSQYMAVNVYGFDQSFSVTYYLSTNSYTSDRPLNAKLIASDIKKFIDTHKFSPWDDENEPKSVVIKNIVDYYGFGGFDPNTPQTFIKIYNDKNKNMQVKLRLYVSSDTMTVELERRKPYSSYNYYYGGKAEYADIMYNVPEIINRCFTALEKQINEAKPYHSFNEWAFEENKKDALKTIKFLKERVFVKRS